MQSPDAREQRIIAPGAAAPLAYPARHPSGGGGDLVPIRSPGKGKVCSVDRRPIVGI